MAKWHDIQRCRKCGRMTANTNIYTGLQTCYARNCGYTENPPPDDITKNYGSTRCPACEHYTAFYNSELCLLTCARCSARHELQMEPLRFVRLANVVEHSDSSVTKTKYIRCDRLLQEE